MKEEPTAKKHRAKAVRSGDFVQVYEYHRIQTTAIPGRKNTSRKEGNKKRVRIDNIYRSKTACKRLINASRDRGEYPDKFVTLTVGDVSWGSDLRAFNYEVHKFMGRSEYYLKIKVHYVLVPQIQWERYEKYGVKIWHGHVYFFGLPYIPNAKLREIWGHGFVRINAIDKDSDMGSYVARYMEQDFTAFEEKGMKRFYRSSGLREPEQLRAESVAQIISTMDLPEECKVYGPVTFINNPIVGPITYSLYDLRKKEQREGFSTVASEQRRNEGRVYPAPRSRPWGAIVGKPLTLLWVQSAPQLFPVMEIASKWV